MKREQLIWTILLVVGAAGLLGRAVFTERGMGREYVRVTTTPAGADRVPAGELWRVCSCAAGAAGTN